jgi:hypothetical protein
MHFAISARKRFSETPFRTMTAMSASFVPDT